MDAIAIIGAGMAGLSAATRLRAQGRAVRVFDKSRGNGGRLATRRADPCSFDHGAPVAEGPPDFDAAMADLGTAAQAGPDGWRGHPGMSGLVAPMAARCDILNGCRIAGIEGRAHVWRLRDEGGATHGPFAGVIVAIPAPQMAALWPDAAEDLGAVAMDPCWTLMAVAGEGASVPGPAGPIVEVVDQSRRPGGMPGAFVAHAGPDWSREMLERAPEEIAAELARVLSLPAPRHAVAHRWRFARTRRPLGRPFLACGGGLVAGGDWALGARAGDAWQSGRAMADALAA